MNKKRVKSLRLLFINRFGRKPNKALYQTDGQVTQPNEFRRFKKLYLKGQLGL
jgi:hypothetical protein